MVIFIDPFYYSMNEHEQIVVNLQNIKPFYSITKQALLSLEWTGTYSISKILKKLYKIQLQQEAVFKKAKETS